MATVDLTIEQILGAVEQLSPADRKRLQRELRRCDDVKPTTLAKRMPRRHTKRMSELLLKANSEALSPAEDAELNALVDEFELLTLAGAQSLARRNKGVAVGARGRRRSTKR